MQLPQPQTATSRRRASHRAHKGLVCRCPTAWVLHCPASSAEDTRYKQYWGQEELEQAKRRATLVFGARWAMSIAYLPTPVFGAALPPLYRLGGPEAHAAPKPGALKGLYLRASGESQARWSPSWRTARTISALA